MATKVIMPQLGESVTEGTIGKWVKQVGDKVEKYETLCEVETDKVNAEVPSTISGIITEIIEGEGKTVSVGLPICYIQEDGELDKVEVKNEEQIAEENKSFTSIVNNDTDKKRYSPVVRRLAEENQLDLNLIQGTGLNGRIRRVDVLKYIDQSKNETTAKETTIHSINQGASEYKVETPRQDYAQRNNIKPAATLENGDEVIDVTSIRKTIANRMVQSKHEAPHAWTTIEVDVTNMVNYRNRIKNDFKQKEGFSITYLPFVIKAVVEAIKEFPILNSIWDHDRIILKKDINISIAVATDNALFVPVIHEADQKSIYGIAKSINHLIQKTKAGKLTLEDMQGGTFTVNNTGSFGSILSAPIINAPQSAILTMESIVKKPVVINDMIAIRSMMNVCVSLDHRVLDGLVVGRFMQSVKNKLESLSIENTKLY